MMSGTPSRHATPIQSAGLGVAHETRDILYEVQSYQGRMHGEYSPNGNFCAMSAKLEPDVRIFTFSLSYFGK